jgi:YfiR/HmsC-like
VALLAGCEKRGQSALSAALNSGIECLRRLLAHRRLAIGLVAAFALAAHTAIATADESAGAVSEDQVKAAYLFNFLKFVEWPETRMASGPWIIGVMGRSDFVQLLEETVGDQMVKNRRVVVKRVRRDGNIAECHLLFVARCEFDGKVPVKPGLLTVGEAQGFSEAGGMINLYVEANKVRFEVAPDAARAAGLRVSPQLLKLGKIR